MKKAARAIMVKDNHLLLMKRNKFGHEYYTLVGGGVHMGEQPDEALTRELQEECGMPMADPRLVFVEDAGVPYGTQYVYLCRYVSGEPALSPDSEEAQLNAMGQNLYQPVWVPLEELAALPFRSAVLKEELLAAFKNGFPKTPKNLTSTAEISYTN